VHNLHGMPGIIGGLVAGLAALGQNEAKLFFPHGTQFGHQVRARCVGNPPALQSAVHNLHFVVPAHFLSCCLLEWCRHDAVVSMHLELVSA